MSQSPNNRPGNVPDNKLDSKMTQSLSLIVDQVVTWLMFHIIVGVSRGYTDHHQGRAIHMADSRID